VNVATGDAARAVDRSLLASVGEMQKWFRAPRAGRASNVHFVTFEWCCPVSVLAKDLDQHLVALKHRFDIQ
jgi:hypothetical protein